MSSDIKKTKHEELIIKEVLDNLYCIEDNHYPLDLIRLWVQFHRVLNELIKNPDYDIELYFAKPIQVLVQKHPGLDYDYQKYYNLLKQIQSLIDKIKSLKYELKSSKEYLKKAIELCEEAYQILRSDWELTPEVRDSFSSKNPSEMLKYEILPLLYAVRDDYDKKDEKGDEKTC